MKQKRKQLPEKQKPANGKLLHSPFEIRPIHILRKVEAETIRFRVYLKAQILIE